MVEDDLGSQRYQSHRELGMSRVLNPGEIEEELSNYETSSEEGSPVHIGKGICIGEGCLWVRGGRHRDGSY